MQSPLVDVIVPVVDRPQAAAPFMASLADVDRVRVLVHPVVELADEVSRAAWCAAGAGGSVRVLVGTVSSFAEKVNLGFAKSSAPFILLAGDDVRFTAGWLDACLRVAESGVSVVGTSEPVNRRVRSGGHSCHPFIRRAYVVEQGASWDGPGVVCHEGYRHWYVDDEIVTVAKQRKVWGFAADAVLEHLHPVHGLADMDAVYRRGQARKEDDRRLFQQRRRQFEEWP